MCTTSWVIATDDVFTCIATRDPYYALTTLAAFKEGMVEAELPIQLASDREVGPITAAEAARHLGVLGSCALAEANRNRSVHYYVPRQATLERSAASSHATQLEAKAS